MKNNVVDPSSSNLESVPWEEECQDVFLKNIYHSVMGPVKLLRAHSNPFWAPGNVFAHMNPFDYFLVSRAYGVTENRDSSDKFNPSRTPPRLFLKDPVSLASTRTEIDGLPQKGKDGIYPLEIIGVQDPRAKNRKKVRAILVVKWKGSLKVRKPLHGLKESPYRWFLAASAFLVEGSFRQCRYGVCVFTHHPDTELGAITVLYVGDMLVTFRAKLDSDIFAKCVARFKTGDAEFLKQREVATVSGLDLVLTENGCLEIVALAGCANVITSAVSLQPHIRDYMGAHFNLSDCEAKPGNRKIPRRVFVTKEDLKLDLRAGERLRA